MLSEKMETALNDQIGMEGYASFLYLSMASWCEFQGLDGTSQFFYRQAAEEHDHMMRIFHYVLEMDSKAIAPAIQQPPSNFDSVQSIFESVYTHEQKVTASINKLVNLANAENDHSTHNFLQWYVSEQREEEALIRLILDKLKLIGDGPQSLYFIDKEITEINSQMDTAEGAA
ncbi:MAG: ferritin [Saprospiraceae bacterium]|nr:ferritin [Saprospiraceae bacterium]